MRLARKIQRGRYYDSLERRSSSNHLICWVAALDDMQTTEMQGSILITYLDTKVQINHVSLSTTKYCFYHMNSIGLSFWPPPPNFDITGGPGALTAWHKGT